MRLILPVGGESTRFGKGVPKWLLRHPEGNLMLYQGLLRLQLDEVHEALIVCREDHYVQYGVGALIERQWREGKIRVPARVIVVPPTRSQPETVNLGLLAAEVEGPIFIKDCDTQFVHAIRPGNSLCCSPFDVFRPREPASKSYLRQDENGRVVALVEKQIISDTFCVGGYGFASAREYRRYYELVKTTPDLYVSHVVQRMLQDGVPFRAEAVTRFEDWGTRHDWELYLERRA